MTEDPRRDIRLGDMSALDPAATETSGPGLSAVEDVVITRQMPAVSLPADAGALPPPAAVPAATAHPLVIPVLAALVVLLLGMVIHLLLTQRELAGSLAVLEEKSRESVATLADKVSSTSTTLRSADSQTQKSLNVVARDIARLEAGIGRLQKALDAQARQQAAATAEAKAALAAEMQRLAQADQQGEAQRDARIKALADGLDALSARQKTLADNLARLERNGEAAQLRAEVALLGADLREMREDYDRRLKAGEQATASSDAFRRQVNATIDRLNQQVSELYQRR
ncbi:MAG: hypothetical protein ACLGHJ_06310 [Gammaproteobacteria bacterium]